MFELDFRNIIVLVSLSIHASLLWIFYRYGRKTPGGKAYSVAILAIAGWIFPMVLYRAHLFGEVVLWVRILYIMASFTSSTFLFFTFVFPDNKKIPSWAQILIVIENLFIIFLCLHPTWMIQGVEIVEQGEDKILWGPLYFLYSNHISLLFLIGFVVLFLKWRRATGIFKKQILMILVGYFFGANLAMVTNLILPWFGYFELNWLGQFFSTIVAAFTTYAILKHKLLDIKVVATEIFLIVLNLFLFFKLIIPSSSKDFLISLFTFLCVLFISFVLIKSVRKEVEQRIKVTQLAESLKKANIRLKELDLQKTEFLSIASHQLRTPLSIVKGYIELIQDGAYGKITKKLDDTLEDMDESNERLVHLVDEFLNVTRIEQGRTKFVFSNCNFGDTVHSVVKELKERAEQKGLKMECSDNLDFKVCMDEEKIRNVIFNFIDNAIKYSEKGTIKVIVDFEGNGVTLKVKDQGFGFGKEDGVNFFQKFYRGKNVVGTNVNGTGLGIYVCKMFVENHGGNVWAKSSGLGKGSEFGFWIPLTNSNQKCQTRKV